MKREGRQHGMVRSYRILPSPLNPRPDSRIVNRFDSPPTAGLFTRVSAKPTNHSKFTGKCARPRCSDCHIHPATKSRDKAKGTQKIRSSDALLSYRLVAGFSATAILDHLGGEYDEEEGDCVDVVHEESCYLANDGLTVEDDDENDKMSFCDVALELDQVDEDEGWCLVGEI
ncbi:hypothetical protein NMG60_11006764 [Bertholletia excelsa]